jgi:hypothetical protein
LTCNECTEFEKLLAFHSAPALLGIKSANLFSVNRSFDVNAYAERFNRKAAAKGLKMKILCSCEKRNLVILYSQKLLSTQLEDPQRRSILESFGYNKTLTLEQCLEKLSERITENDDFPHEIGLFLNYPTEDVMGFIQNKGSNFKLCGYWKVYVNAEKAQRTFDNYNKCRNFLCNKLNQGNDIYQALRIS